MLFRSDSDEEDSAEKKRKVVDGFWQKMVTYTHTHYTPTHMQGLTRGGSHSTLTHTHT